MTSEKKYSTRLDGTDKVNQPVLSTNEAQLELIKKFLIGASPEQTTRLLTLRDKVQLLKKYTLEKESGDSE